MSYSDLGCYGSEIPTPNLDALAGKGVRLTQFYNNARCSPTRASLITGLYPHEAGIGRMSEDPEAPKSHNEGVDGYRGSLTKNSVTIAEVLRSSRYHT
jgi:arylsulfatase A-like enzyme